MRVIVLGSGRLGKLLATRLDAAGHTVNIVDRDRDAFRGLPERFTGRAVLGLAYDRDVLEQAEIREADAVAAVTSGDNSNIVAARIAKETYEVPRVVARIKDPQRAEIYQRLGIATVAMYSWLADQVLRRIFVDEMSSDWSDASGSLQLVEIDLPAAWAGERLDALTADERIRLVAVSRAGSARLAKPAMVGQEGDVLHFMIESEAQSTLKDLLATRPEGGH